MLQLAQSHKMMSLSFFGIIRILCEGLFFVSVDAAKINFSKYFFRIFADYRSRKLPKKIDKSNVEISDEVDALI